MSSRAHFSKDVLLNDTAQAVGAAATNQVVSNVFAIQQPFRTAFIMDIYCSSVTAATGITAKLQVTQSTDESWIDSQTVSVTGNGRFTIKLLDTVAGDQTYLPLRPLARVVVTTGAGDAVTVDNIYIPQS